MVFITNKFLSKAHGELLMKATLKIIEFRYLELP